MMEVVPPQKITVKNEVELADFAADFTAKITPGPIGATVVALVGPLGAGKTTLVGKILATYGVTDPVTSPTYTIETVYRLPSGPFARAYHLDAYRLGGPADLEALDFTDRLADLENLILIEWADRVKDVLPGDSERIFIQIGESDERIITISNG